MSWRGKDRPHLSSHKYEDSHPRSSLHHQPRHETDRRSSHSSENRPRSYKSHKGNQFRNERNITAAQRDKRKKRKERKRPPPRPHRESHNNQQRSPLRSHGQVPAARHRKQYSPRDSLHLHNRNHHEQSNTQHSTTTGHPNIPVLELLNAHPQEQALLAAAIASITTNTTLQDQSATVPPAQSTAAPESSGKQLPSQQVDISATVPPAQFIAASPVAKQLPSEKVRQIVGTNSPHKVPPWNPPPEVNLTARKQTHPVKISAATTAKGSNTPQLHSLPNLVEGAKHQAHPLPRVRIAHKSSQPGIVVAASATAISAVTPAADKASTPNTSNLPSPPANKKTTSSSSSSSSSNSDSSSSEESGDSQSSGGKAGRKRAWVRPLMVDKTTQCNIPIALGIPEVERALLSRSKADRELFEYQIRILGTAILSGNSPLESQFTIKPVKPPPRKKQPLKKALSSNTKS